jgi:formylmethanofuran dehydrogenase subunit D
MFFICAQFDGKISFFYKITLKYNCLNSIGKVIVMVEQMLNVTLLSGRTIEQGVGKEKGKSSIEYFDACSMCYMDGEDMKKLGVKNNTNILVTTDNGSVILKAVKYPRAATPGLIYIPYGPWANAVCSDKTTSIGMPSFKGTPAKVEAAVDKKVLTMEELLKSEFGR